jgi:hypothetical protein
MSIIFSNLLVKCAATVNAIKTCRKADKKVNPDSVKRKLNIKISNNFIKFKL